MATSISLRLSNRYKEWENIFRLQSTSQYVEALVASNSVPKPDPVSSLYLKLVQLNLEMCVAASSGVEPTQDMQMALSDLVKQATSVSCTEVLIEGLFVLFDCFPVLRDFAIEQLVLLESRMDGHTRRRWIHRRGQQLISQDNLHEAFDLWRPYIMESDADPLNGDDSLACLLLDFGRLASQMGRNTEAVEIYNQALCASRSIHNQALSLIRVSNALERTSRPGQADKRRIEYFQLIEKEYPTQCALCSGILAKEPKYLIPCCKTIVHAECLRTIVSDHSDDTNNCPFCKTSFMIGDVVDPTASTGRKYKRAKKSSIAEPSVDNLDRDETIAQNKEE